MAQQMVPQKAHWTVLQRDKHWVRELVPSKVLHLDLPMAAHLAQPSVMPMARSKDRRKEHWLGEPKE
jgi:hypothetical protein